MTEFWTMLYQNALHASPSELPASIQNASNAMYTRLNELGRSRRHDDVREKSEIYRALSDLYVLSNCGPGL
jgi:hypothetical protein